MQRKLSIMGVLVTILVAVTFSLSYAEGRVTGRSVHFTPHLALVGEIVKISVRFTVTERPVNLTAIVEQVTPRRVGPPPPTLVLGTFNPGDHVVDVYRYTVPTSPPERICFNIKITGGEFRNVCLKRGRDTRGWFMDIESYGRWVEAAPIPQPAAPSAEKPDLRIVGNLAIDSVLKIENIGRGTAHNVRAVRECFVEGRWVRSGGEFGETRVLGSGQSVPIRIGRLGRLLGPCPSGTTKVRVVVDPRNEIAEMDENNNIMEMDARADLAIVYFFVWSPYYDNNLSIKISNTGVGDAGPFGWDVSVYRDGEWRSFIGESIRGLPSGRSITIRKRTGLAVREGERVRLRVDGFNEVPETNEDNNFQETTVRRR